LPENGITAIDASAILIIPVDFASSIFSLASKS
jgi:hypothetical protein